MHFYRLLFLFMALQLSMESTFATDVEQIDESAFCTEVRLDRNNGPFSKLPVYNQALGTSSETSICYAVTASLLIDAHRIQSEGAIQQFSSPLSIALQTRLSDSITPDPMRKLSYNDADPLSFLIGGGSISGALQFSQNQQLCDQKWLEQEASLIDGSRPVDQFLNELIHGSPFTAPDRRLIESVRNRLLEKCAQNSFQPRFPNFRTQASPGGDYLEALGQLFEKQQNPALTADEKKRLANEFNERFDPIRNAKYFMRTVDRVLEMPKSSGIGIGYLYKALKSSGANESIGAHASVIIGRRFNPQTRKCEYLVRDSFGRSCTDQNGRPRYRLPCENGNIWVERISLLKETMNLTWIP